MKVEGCTLSTLTTITALTFAKTKAHAMHKNRTWHVTAMLDKDTHFWTSDLLLLFNTVGATQKSTDNDVSASGNAVFFKMPTPSPASLKTPKEDAWQRHSFLGIWPAATAIITQWQELRSPRTMTCPLWALLSFSRSRPQVHICMLKVRLRWKHARIHQAIAPSSWCGPSQAWKPRAPS